MSNEPNQEPTPEQQFLTALRKLDAGGRAKLKRNAGNMLSEGRNVYDVFFATLPYNVHAAQHEAFFMIATLFAFGTHRNDPVVSNPPRNFGASLRLVRDSEKAGSLDRRFNALLDADSEQLPFRLRQMVSLLASRRVAVNWEKLLRDVGRWNNQNRYVQRNWAQDYYGQSSASDKE